MLSECKAATGPSIPANPRALIIASRAAGRDALPSFDVVSISYVRELRDGGVNRVVNALAPINFEQTFIVDEVQALCQYA